jgi:hypothetical protein
MEPKEIDVPSGCTVSVMIVCGVLEESAGASLYDVQ